MSKKRGNNDDEYGLSGGELHDLHIIENEMQGGQFYTLHEIRASEYEGDNWITLTVLVRPSPKRELFDLSRKARMEMHEFVLVALKEKGLSVTDDDLHLRVIDA